ncbi:MAG: DUF2065 domain-containing protein [Gammaproteobacteria bacterium]|nr:DUF2065 domain-containing protein [Gammaproteobacteria bacterium]
MWQDLMAAGALVLVLEGILPFLNPRRYRETMQAITQFNDQTLRGIGLLSMAAGVGLLYFVRTFT